jgi:hypothetical protein
MATRYNYTGGIVTNGLVLNLDAAKTDSYPGTGTTWRDLSGRGNNGTLTNGPTFSGIGKQASIVFDGVDDYVGLPNLNINFPFHVSFFASEVSGPGGGPVVTFTDPNGNNVPFMLQINKSVNAIRLAYYPSGGSFTSTNYTNINYNQIYYCSANCTSTSWDLYVNGTYISSLTDSFSKTWTDTNTSYNICLANRTPGAFYSKGNVYATQIYNRTLTATEVSQNFNALRGRYGI